MKTIKTDKEIEQLAELITTGEGVGQHMDKPPRIANFMLGYKACENEPKQHSRGIYTREQLVACWIEGQSFLEGNSKFENIDDFIESITKKSAYGNVLVDQSEEGNIDVQANP